MALENTDLIIVGRGSTSYQTTYQNLADSINAGGVGVGSTPGINQVLNAYNLADLGQVLRFKVGAGNTSPGITTDSLPSLLGSGAGAAHRALYSSYSDTLDSNNPRHTDITAYGFKTYDIDSDLSPHGGVFINPEWGIEGYNKRTEGYSFSAGVNGFEYASDNSNNEYRISAGRPYSYDADSAVLELSSPVSKLNTQESNALVVSRYGEPTGPTNDFVITTDGNVSAGGSIGIAGTFYGDGSGLTNVGSSSSVRDVLAEGNIADPGQTLKFRVTGAGVSYNVPTTTNTITLDGRFASRYGASASIHQVNEPFTIDTESGISSYQNAKGYLAAHEVGFNGQYQSGGGNEYVAYSNFGIGAVYWSSTRQGVGADPNNDVSLNIASSGLSFQSPNLKITSAGNVSIAGTIGVGTIYGDGSGLTNVGSSSSIRDVLAEGNQAGNFQVLRFRDPNTSGIPTGILDEETIEDLNNLYVTGSHRAAWSNLSALDVNSDGGETAYNNNVSFEGVNIQYQSNDGNASRQFHATTDGFYGNARRDNYNGEYYYRMTPRVFEHEFRKEWGDTTLYPNTVFSRLNFNPQSDSFSNAYGGQGLSLTYHPDSRSGTISTNPSVAISIGTTSNFDGWNSDYEDYIDFQVKTDGTVSTSSSITAATFYGDGSNLTNVGANPHPGTRYKYNGVISTALDIDNLGDGEFWINTSGGNFDIWVAAVDSQGVDQFGNINATFTHTYNPKQIFTIRDLYNGAPVRHGQFEIISVSNESSGRKIKFECGASASNVFHEQGGALQNGDEYSLDITGWL